MTKILKKNRPLYIFCPQIIFKKNLYENWHNYFLIKEEKVFTKQMEILEKVSNIFNKKFNSELIYNKNI